MGGGSASTSTAVLVLVLVLVLVPEHPLFPSPRRTGLRFSIFSVSMRTPCLISVSSLDEQLKLGDRFTSSSHGLRSASRRTSNPSTYGCGSTRLVLGWYRGSTRVVLE